MPKFKLGDRVKRPIDVYAPLKDWKYKHGVIVRVYSLTRQESKHGPYPEMYDVRWDDKPEFIDKGFLPHGLDLDNEYYEELNKNKGANNANISS